MTEYMNTAWKKYYSWYESGTEEQRKFADLSIIAGAVLLFLLVIN